MKKKKKIKKKNLKKKKMNQNQHLEDKKDTKNDTRDSLKNSIIILEETRNVGSETMISLHKQGKQLENCQRNVEVIEDHMNRSNRILNGMSSFFSRIYNKFTKDKSYRNEDQFTKFRENKNTDQNNIFATQNNLNKNNISSSQNSMNDPFDKECDDQLDQISSILRDLQEQGKVMNDEIQYQNKMIDNLNHSVSKQNNRIVNTNRKINNLL